MCTGSCGDEQQDYLCRVVEGGFGACSDYSGMKACPSGGDSRAMVLFKATRTSLWSWNLTILAYFNAPSLYQRENLPSKRTNDGKPAFRYTTEVPGMASGWLSKDLPLI